jgi:hypothetical protein
VVPEGLRGDLPVRKVETRMRVTERVLVPSADVYVRAFAQPIEGDLLLVASEDCLPEIALDIADLQPG